MIQRARLVVHCSVFAYLAMPVLARAQDQGAQNEWLVARSTYSPYPSVEPASEAAQPLTTGYYSQMYFVQAQTSFPFLAADTIEPVETATMPFVYSTDSFNLAAMPTVASTPVFIEPPKRSIKDCDTVLKTLFDLSMAPNWWLGEFEEKYKNEQGQECRSVRVMGRDPETKAEWDSGIRCAIC